MKLMCGKETLLNQYREQGCLLQNDTSHFGMYSADSRPERLHHDSQ